MPGLGAVIKLQLLPFQCSIKTCDASAIEWCQNPTAKQLVVLRHAMLEGKVEVEPLGFGLPTIAHVEPFQRSVKFRVAVEVS